MIGDHMTKSTSWSFSGVFCHLATYEVRKEANIAQQGSQSQTVNCLDQIGQRAI